MKKVVAGLLLTTSMLHTLYAAEAQVDLSGVYVGTALAFEAVPKHQDNGLGLLIKAGKKLDRVLENLAVEVEISASLIDPQYNGRKADILTFATYAAYTIHLPKLPVTFRPRFGVIAPNLGDSESVHSRNIGFSSGLLGAYALTPHVNVFIDYTNLGEKVNNYSAGAEFSF